MATVWHNARGAPALALALAPALASGLVLLSVPAMAQDRYDGGSDSPFYVEGRVAGSILSDSDLSGDVDGEASYDTGFGGGAALGYRLHPGWRVEIEGVAETNNVETATPVDPNIAANFAQTGVDPSGLGDLITLGGFVNAFYDWDTGTAFTPFVGAGFGGLHLEAEFDGMGLDDTDIVPAYQARTGVAWHVTGNTALALGYRYRATIGDPEFDSTQGEVELDYAGHAVELSLRLGF